jgi:DNA replication licensing factor MCM2
VPLREWIAEARTRRELKRRFKRFLLDTKVRRCCFSGHEACRDSCGHAPAMQDDKGRETYVDKIKHICAANLASLEVDYGQMSSSNPTLGVWVIDAPRDMIEIFDEASHASLWSGSRPHG